MEIASNQLSEESNVDAMKAEQLDDKGVIWFILWNKENKKKQTYK